MTSQESLTKRSLEGARHERLATEDFYEIPFEIMQLERDIEEGAEQIKEKRIRLKYLKSLTLKP